MLIDGFQDEYHAASRLIEAINDGEIEAVASRKVKNEYRLIERRLINDGRYENRIDDFFEQLINVEPQSVSVVIDDEEDMKFIEAAVGGKAEYIVTSDKHLLDVGEVGAIRIITPQEAWRVFEDVTGGQGEWQAFMKNLGFGK